MILQKRDYRKYTEDEKSIRNDSIFKIIFGANERSQYLKEFLESILHEKITNIVIRNDVALDKIHADNKQMRLDILAEINNNEKVNIEFQNKNEYNVFERSEVYASGIYYNSLRVGNKYIQANKTIVIWLLGFNVFIDGTYHEIARTKRDFNDKELTNNITYHYIQLPKFLEQVEEIKTPEEQWLAYLSGSLNKKEMEELFKMNRSIEEINEIVDIVMTDADVRDALNERILAENLEALKMAKAFKDGKIEDAKKMLEEGFDIEKVCKITGLTEEEIRGWLKDRKRQGSV